MTPRRGIAWKLAGAGALVAGLGLAAWWSAARLRGEPGDRPADAASPGPAAPAAPARAVPVRPGDPALPAGAAEVAITGRVIDVQQQQRQVGSVEVVFRGAGGDATATTRHDGTYAIRVAPGGYRTFVRDAALLSFARRDPPRLPGAPPAEIAGVPDEALMPEVVVARDTDGVDLPVVRGGAIAGRVVDRAGRPIRGALVQALGSALRPALATDLAESGADGGFELRLPPGTVELVASHPRFAGLADGTRTRYTVSPGRRADASLVMTAGCIVTGRVVARGGAPAGDGALERQWGSGELEFAPTGRIEPDGSFRWSSTEDGEVRLRGWPWKSPPSAIRRFACRDGARFDGVVLALPERRPDLEGVLVDRTGRPIAYGFLDIKALDGDGVGQQERADGDGRWAVYAVPPGRYRIAVHGDGGVLATTVVAPRDGIRLELGGTGRLDGVAPRIATGSFELALDSCLVDGERIPLPQSRRLVTVTAGRFSAADLPACELSFAAIWRGRSLAQQLAIPAGGAAQIELAVGEPRDKTVRGTVRDARGATVAGAVVTVVHPDDDARAATAVTDTAGRYSIKAFAGANLSASARGVAGYAQVGAANIDAEQVDITLGDPGDREPDGADRGD